MGKNPLDINVDNLAEICKKIMLKSIDSGELSKTDLFFLTMYQKEKRLATKVPTYKKVINITKEFYTSLMEIKDKFNSLIPDNEDHEDSNDIIDLNNIKEI